MKIGVQCYCGLDGLLKFERQIKKQYNATVVIAYTKPHAKRRALKFAHSLTCKVRVFRGLVVQNLDVPFSPSLSQGSVVWFVVVGGN